MKTLSAEHQGYKDSIKGFMKNERYISPKAKTRAIIASKPCKNCGKKGCNCSRKTLEKDTRNY